MVEITEEGQKPKDRAVEIPEKVATCINLDAEEFFIKLYIKF